MIQALECTGDLIQAMLDVLGGLPNITDCYVTWHGVHSRNSSTTTNPIISTVFHSNLRKLSLEVSLENMVNLQLPSLQVQNLEELQICIRSENGKSVSERKDILSYHLAPAIRKLSTLRTFSVELWEPEDLSPLFLAIGTLPELMEFVVCIPAESAHFGDPKGLSYFLNQHSLTLQTLRLRARSDDKTVLWGNSTSFDAWIKGAIEGVALPHLLTLDVSSQHIPVDTSAAVLHSFSSTLTSLSLTGCYQKFEDVEKIVRMVSSYPRGQPLSNLRLGVISLSPQLIDLIAAQLPKLHKLELIVRHILPHRTDKPVFLDMLPSKGQQPDQIVSVECIPTSKTNSAITKPIY